MAAPAWRRAEGGGIQAKKEARALRPPPPCHRATKPVKAPTVGRPPNDKPSFTGASAHRRVLEPPQVAPTCLLGGKPLAQRRPSIEERFLPSGEQQRLCRPRGAAVENSEPSSTGSLGCGRGFRLWIMWINAIGLQAKLRAKSGLWVAARPCHPFAPNKLCPKPESLSHWDLGHT
jgi:hypothetical protein